MDAHDARQIPRGLRAELSRTVPCSPRTVDRALQGRPLSLVARAAIRAELAKRGLLHLLPEERR